MMLQTVQHSESNPAKNKSHVVIRPDGSIVATDLWADYNLLAKPDSSLFPVRLKQSEEQVSDANPIGIVDYGVLLGEEPAVSGSTGAGAIYIHGCHVRCKTCYQPEFFSKKARVYTS